MRELPVGTEVRFTPRGDCQPQAGRIVYQVRDSESGLLAYHIRDASCGMAYRVPPHLVEEPASRLCSHCGAPIPKDT